MSNRKHEGMGEWAQRVIDWVRENPAERRSSIEYEITGLDIPHRVTLTVITDGSGYLTESTSVRYVGRGRTLPAACDRALTRAEAGERQRREDHINRANRTEGLVTS